MPVTWASAQECRRVSRAAGRGCGEGRGLHCNPLGKTAAPGCAPASVGGGKHPPRGLPSRALSLPVVQPARSHVGAGCGAGLFRRSRLFSVSRHVTGAGNRGRARKGTVEGTWTLRTSPSQNLQPRALDSPGGRTGPPHVQAPWSCPPVQ